VLGQVQHEPVDQLGVRAQRSRRRARPWCVSELHRGTEAVGDDGLDGPRDVRGLVAAELHLLDRP
jgi:hypothetical protein